MSIFDLLADAPVVETPATLTQELRAPFPYFGGKRRAAALIWERLGDVVNYVEPFAGSLAVLLARPAHHVARVETINDIDALIANVWRAIATDPEGVARGCDWPVIEVDLHARHRALIEARPHLAEKLEADPRWCDVELAAWWIWGISCWIGAGWCADSEMANRKRPAIGGDGGPRNGGGVHGYAQRGSSVAKGHTCPPREVSRRLPDVGAGRNWDGETPQPRDGKGVHGSLTRTALYDTFALLHARTRYVRVTCGPWQRVTTPAVTWKHGVTGVVLDPPYGKDARRTAGIYAHDSLSTAEECRRWCVEAGARPDMRIALCGYQGEHQELERHGWVVVPWKAHGGYGVQSDGAGRENAERERIWFSPHCLPPARHDQLRLW